MRSLRLVLLAPLLVVACDRGDEAPPTAERPAGIPESANWEVHRDLLAARDASYSPADGGGGATLVSASDVRAAEQGEFVIVYRAGPLGVAVGGGVHLQVSPFWGWSAPQTRAPGAPGYTEVTWDAPAGATITPEERPGGLLLLRVGDEPLREGETITIRYGAGETARVDKYADDLETFHVWVDGDGDADGTRRLVAHDMRIEVKPREAVELVVTAPSVAAVDERFEVAVAALDAAGNVALGFEGTVSLHADDAVTVDGETRFAPPDRGARRVDARVAEAGIYYVLAEVEGFAYRSNPIVVRERPRRMLWADLQIHSSLSDGTASPAALYRYARDVAALDVAAVTDHDHHGMHKLDESPLLWEGIKETTRAHHDPGRFVTLIGYEWTSWIWGHRHVLYFGDDGDLFSSLTPPTDTPQGLWAALAATDAITIPHHPAGGAQAVDWSVAPDRRREPVVEIVSVHGSSEVMGGPLTIHRPREGHFVRDALAKGYRLGFVGSTDGHDGHPGLGHKAAPSGGIAALLTGDRTRAAVRDALMARKTYATSGERIYVEFSLGPHGMGSVVPPAVDGDNALAYRAYVVGTAPIVALDLIKNGELVHRVEPDEGEEQGGLLFPDEARALGDAVYLRVAQANGHCAWTSPIFTASE